MKFTFYLSAFILWSGSAYSQHDEAYVEYMHFEGALSPQSASLGGKRIETREINLDELDEAIVVYQSFDYPVSLRVIDTKSEKWKYDADDAEFKLAFGSKVLVRFDAPHGGGLIRFEFTSMGPSEQLGKFKAHIFIHKKSQDHVTFSYPGYCLLMKYIAASAKTNFELIKDLEKPGAGKNDTWAPTVYLLSGYTTRITKAVGNMYGVYFLPTTDLEYAKKNLEGTGKQIEECFPGIVKKEYTAETVSSFDKNDFVGRLEYSMPGKNEYDLNPLHWSSNIKFRIILKLYKDKVGDGKENYRMIMIIQ